MISMQTIENMAEEIVKEKEYYGDYVTLKSLIIYNFGQLMRSQAIVDLRPDPADDEYKGGYCDGNGHPISDNNPDVKSFKAWMRHNGGCGNADMAKVMRKEQKMATLEDVLPYKIPTGEK